MSRKENCLFSGLIASLSLALDLEENRKLYHAWRVALLSWPISKIICPREAGIIFYGALLHDIGAIGMDDHIVHKAVHGTTDAIEIRRHPQRGAAIIKIIPELKHAARYILEHHEMWNGSGYPKGLKGNEISLGAQIIAAADLFDVILRRVGKIPLEGMLNKIRSYVSSYISEEIFGVLLQVLTTDFYNQLQSDQGLEEAMKEVLKKVPPPSEKLNDTTSTTSALAAVIDAKHQYTAGHSERVALYALNIGSEMGLNLNEMEKLQRAGLLHDLGKIGVPRSILDKPGGLTKEEFGIIKKHPQGTIDILSMIDVFNDIAYIAGGHHERVDGQGYPYGLYRDEIPLMGRILAVADAFDAITSNRPYQPTRNKEEAFRILQKNCGSQFDKEVVEAALEGLKDVDLI